MVVCGGKKVTNIWFTDSNQHYSLFWFHLFATKLGRVAVRDVLRLLLTGLLGLTTELRRLTSRLWRFVQLLGETWTRRREDLWMISVLEICLGVSGRWVTWRGVGEVSGRALLERLRLRVALVKGTASAARGSVTLTAGWRELAVKGRVLWWVKLMTDDWLGMCSAWPSGLRLRLPCHDGEQRAFLFGVQLILQVRQETASLDTAAEKREKAVLLKIQITMTKSQKNGHQTHLSVIHSGRMTFSPLRSWILLLGKLLAMMWVVLERE